MNFVALHLVQHVAQLMAAPQHGWAALLHRLQIKQQSALSTGQMAAALSGAASWLRQSVRCSISRQVPKVPCRRGPARHKGAAAGALPGMKELPQELPAASPLAAVRHSASFYEVLPDTSNLAEQGGPAPC